MNRPPRVVVVGDALLDRDLDGRVRRVAPDAPAPVVEAIDACARPGGAALAATLAARHGAEVRLVCALGDDAAGATLRGLLDAAGVEVVDLGRAGATPEKVRVRADGQTLVRLDHGEARAACGPLPAGALDAADALLVADYGGGLTASGGLRCALEDRARTLPVVWDPHPRGSRPVPGVTVVTPNLREATTAARVDPDRPLAAAEAAGQILRRRWGAVSTCVTLGARGVVLVGADGPPLAVPATPVEGDACGAGDAFAAALVVQLARGALPSEGVRAGVAAASAFVAAGGASGSAGHVAPAPAAAASEPPDALAARVRAEGGVVVAAGGCFDLLHAGHVALLTQARALGDCLVVCLNSDASIGRLKGPGRPVVGQHDRAAVLSALACVDAVAVFAEDDPRAVLHRIRPHVWVKGGDYAGGELPESATLAGWGGQAVTVPYVSGRSTTMLIQEAARAR